LADCCPWHLPPAEIPRKVGFSKKPDYTPDPVLFFGLLVE
jgi:hypothetical protein